MNPSRWGPAIAVLVGLALALPGGFAASPPAPLPLADDGRFLGNLSAPVLSSGASGSVAGTLSDPLTVPLTAVVLVFELYAFTAAPGGNVGALPDTGVQLPSGNASETSISMAIGTLSPGAPALAIAFPVFAESGAPAGAYDLRSSLQFDANGTSYRLESRGFFSDAAWSAATRPSAGGGPGTLNLSELGVQGILPETAVGVVANGFPTIVLGLAVGGYLYVRRGPGSRAGADGAPPPQSAPSAAGK